MIKKYTLLYFLLAFMLPGPSMLRACSVLYYIDKQTGKIYVANNEDYWYNVKVYLQIMPKSKNEYARLWYGWNSFAQGGINSEGLFFDGAVTPEQKMPDGYHAPKGNLGDEILAFCNSVQQAIDYLEKKKVALINGHMMFGDKNGSAVVIEWINGEKKMNRISENKLVMTNFLLNDTTQGNYPCYRYQSIEKRIEEMERDTAPITLLKVGNTMGQAVQVPKPDKNGKIGGTLYSTFISITDMELVLVYKLDNTKKIKMDLKTEFNNQNEKKIKLE